jgi:XrtJ-associated TM-motif-TM protein
MNTKNFTVAVAFTLMLATAFPLRAQSGCVDSPEDPTIVLALVGGAVAVAASLWRSLRHKR